MTTSVSLNMKFSENLWSQVHTYHNKTINELKYSAWRYGQKKKIETAATTKQRIKKHLQIFLYLFWWMQGIWKLFTVCLSVKVTFLLIIDWVVVVLGEMKFKAAHKTLFIAMGIFKNTFAACTLRVSPEQFMCLCVVCFTVGCCLLQAFSHLSCCTFSAILRYQDTKKFVWVF